ncbi:MAG: DUF4149 domain-containing protein [Nitrospinae bacterium]|nr:DUF4149 domain-containing protein [Nitrospinota bacterium]
MAYVKYIHLLTLCVWVGGMVFFSFIGAPAIFKHLTRDMAGTVVGAIFPKYWMMGYVCSLLLLGTLFYIAKGNVSAFKMQFGILAVAVALSFVSGMVIGVKARDIKAQMNAEQNAEKREALHKEFGRIHGISAITNMAVLFLMLGYLWYVPAVVKPAFTESAKSFLGL